MRLSSGADQAHTSPLLGHGLGAQRCHERVRGPLDQVPVDPTALVQDPQRGLHSPRERVALRVRQRVEVEAANGVRERDVPALVSSIASSTNPGRKQVC